jgi:phosphatidylglycerophosphate synthase
MKITESFKEQGILLKISRYASIPIVWICLKLHIKPNTVSWFNILFNIVCFIPLLYNYYILTFIFLFIHITLDCVDGEVARLTKTFSRYGSFLDYLGAITCVPLIHIGIGMSQEMFLLSSISTILYVLVQYPKMIDIQPKKRFISSGVPEFSYGFLLFTLIGIFIDNMYLGFILFNIFFIVVYLSSINPLVFSMNIIKQGIIKSRKKVEERKNE